LLPSSICTRRWRTLNARSNGESRLSRRLKPAALRKDITESLKWIGTKGQVVRDDNLELYKKVKPAAIEQEKSNRLY